jgi:predicted DNA binding CopG/RHH family protein
MPGKEGILGREASNMKKIPKFKSEEEAARFWEAHSFEGYQEDTKEAEIGFVKKPKKTVALRLDPADIKSVETIAKRKGLSYTSLLRMWIKEHLAKEKRHVA